MPKYEPLNLKDGIVLDETHVKHLEDGIANAEGIVGPKGDKGDKGATGEKGLTGDKGIQGDKGATGTAGTAGAKGDQGIAGTAGKDGAAGASIKSLEFTTDAEGKVTGGTSTLTDNTVLTITIK